MYAINTVAAECTPKLLENISIMNPSAKARIKTKYRGVLNGSRITNKI
jgi:hypothetical protein